MILAAAAYSLVYLLCPIKGEKGDWAVNLTLNENAGEMIYEESTGYTRSFPAIFGQTTVRSITDVGSVITIDRTTLEFRKADLRGNLVTAVCQLKRAPTRAF